MDKWSKRFEQRKNVYGLWKSRCHVCHDQNVKLRYIDPKQVLPEVVADRETPGNSWGKTGTFEAELSLIG